MAVLNLTRFCFSYKSPKSAATPVSEEEWDPSRMKQSRIILPNKKPLKWSTGVSPGDYGGPPTTTKLRKYWGGDDGDPLTSDDFIWNKEFMSRMKNLLQQSDPTSSSSSLRSSQSKSKEESGFLSLNRAMSLESVEIDLSKELVAPPKPVLELQVEAARSGQLAKDSSGNESPKWRFVPTRREQEKWDRANKAASGGSDVLLRDSKKVRGDPKISAAQSREQYFELKKRLQLLTLGIGGIGVFSAYVSYSPEIAARNVRLIIPLIHKICSILSFGIGLLGSLVYVRMLGNSVDSMADGAKGLIKGAVGQPRLLVPAVLVMIYSRWNGILVPDYGFMHLELIPMLVGFFTYKIATFVQAVEDTVTVVEKQQ